MGTANSSANTLMTLHQALFRLFSGCANTLKPNHTRNWLTAGTPAKKNASNLRDN